MAGSAIDNLLILIDAAFLGKVGSVALAASALGGIFYLSLLMVGWGFGIGAQIIIARRFGEGNYAEVGKTMQHAALFMVPLSLFFFLLTFFGAQAFFNANIDSPELYQAINTFVSFRIFGFFFAFTNILFRSFYIGILKTRIISISSLVIASVNIVLDWLLIFGNLGFPKMGIAGAAIATVIAEVCGTVFFIVFTLQRKDIIEFEIFKKLDFSFQRLKNIIKVASPVMLQFSISFAGWFLFFLFVEHMGVNAVAASNINRSIYMIVLLPLWGVASAANSLVSSKIGEGRTPEVIPVIVKICLLSLAATGVLVLLVNLFAGLLFGFFTNDQQLLNVSYSILYIVSTSSVLLAIGVVLFNGVSGTGNTHITLFFEIFVMASYVFIAWYFSHNGNYGVAWVWLAEVFYGLSMAILSALYLWKGNWKNRKI